MTLPNITECIHDLEIIDDSFDHEFGCEVIEYLQCKICGATSEEDGEIPDDLSDWCNYY